MELPGRVLAVDWGRGSPERTFRDGCPSLTEGAFDYPS